MHVVAYGDPFNGMQLVGPFFEHDDALLHVEGAGHVGRSCSCRLRRLRMQKTTQLRC